jgi:aminoglycoside phosphotransferase (APT) family kinase protein
VTSSHDDLLDPVALAEWMDGEALPGAGFELTWNSIGGGSQNAVFDIRRGEDRWVLRRPPRDAPPGRDQIMLREHRILAALAGTDVPHARARGVCADPTVIGAPFYLMDFVDGWSPASRRVWPSPFDVDRVARRTLAFELVDAIAALSRVDWRARGLADLGRPDGFHDRQVERWLAHLATAPVRHLPGLDEATVWLREHRPSHYDPGIMHGDYQFANVMFHHPPVPRMAAVVDWEMATIGDPLLDLAWVLMDWPNPGEPPSALDYVDYDGLPTREELLARYAERSGRDAGEIDYYVILARFKFAIVLEVGYARYRQGSAWSEKQAVYGDVATNAARRAGELARSSALT